MLFLFYNMYLYVISYNIVLYILLIIYYNNAEYSSI